MLKFIAALALLMVPVAVEAAPNEPIIIYQDYSKICSMNKINDMRIRDTQVTAEREARKLKKAGQTVRMIRIVPAGMVNKFNFVDGETQIVSGC